MTGGPGTCADIIGLGVVGPVPFVAGATNYLTSTADAVVTAARDAGVDRADIDGLIVNAGGRTGPDYDQLISYLGLDLRAALQVMAHGRFTATILYQAASLVRDGFAEVVACVWGQGPPPEDESIIGHGDLGEELRPGGGAHSENPYVGLTRPVGTAALSARRYLESYNVDARRLYDVVGASRRNARHYAKAIRPDMLSRDQYLDAPFLVEPLRQWDWLASAAGAVCVLVGRRQTTGDVSRRVRLAGFAPLPAGSSEFVWARRGLGMGSQPFVPQPPADRRVFSETGISPTDVSVFFTHDACSILVWLALERYGYAQPGGGPGLVEDRGIAYDGGFPVNPHGGSLSAGQLGAWLNIAEAVIQLRGEAGERQVPRAEVAHYGSASGDTLIMTRS